MVPAVELVGQDEGVDSGGRDAVERGTSTARLGGSRLQIQLKEARREKSRRGQAGDKDGQEGRARGVAEIDGAVGQGLRFGAS